MPEPIHVRDPEWPSRGDGEQTVGAGARAQWGQFPLGQWNPLGTMVTGAQQWERAYAMGLCTHTWAEW